MRVVILSTRVRNNSFEFFVENKYLINLEISRKCSKVET
jgi:hypothetical protein